MAKARNLKVNLGSGEDYIEGWVNVDANKKNKVDLVADLNQKFPFEDSSVQEVKASDILEHFTKEGGERFLKECHRIMKRGGDLFIRTHNFFQIYDQFKNDPLVLMHFLYGDTADSDEFGAHKFAYTEESIQNEFKKIGFEIISLKKETTNFVIKARKVERVSKELSIGIVMQSPDLGGAETYMLSLIEKFMKEGNDVYLASNKGKFLNEAKRLSIRTSEIPIVLDVIGNFRGLIKTILMVPYATIYYSNLLYLFRKKKIDVILMSNFTEKIFVSFLSLFFRIPVVWIEYGRLETIFRKNFYLPKIIYRLAKNVPKKFIVPSKNTRESLILDARVSLAKISLIPLGVNTPRRANNKSKDKFVIGNVSRLTKEKGQEYLIKAMPYVLKEIPNAEILIIGEGPDRKHFQNLISELNLNTKVKLLGFVRDVDEFYQRMDLFVFPSVWDLEGFGLVIIEAMSHKIPVIASNIGPVPEIVIDDKTGILIDPGDEKAIARKIIYMAKDPVRKIKMAESGYQRFIEKYTLDRSAKSVMEILRDAAIN